MYYILINVILNMLFYIILSDIFLLHLTFCITILWIKKREFKKTVGGTIKCRSKTKKIFS